MTAHSLDGEHVLCCHVTIAAEIVHLRTKVAEGMSRMAKTLVATKYEGIVQDVVRHALRFRCQGFLYPLV